MDGPTNGQVKTSEIAELVWRAARHAGKESAAKFVHSVAGALVEHLLPERDGGVSGGGGAGEGGGGEEQREEGDSIFTRAKLAKLFVKVRWRCVWEIWGVCTTQIGKHKTVTIVLGYYYYYIYFYRYVFNSRVFYPEHYSRSEREWRWPIVFSYSVNGGFILFFSSVLSAAATGYGKDREGRESHENACRSLTTIGLAFLQYRDGACRICFRQPGFVSLWR